MAITTGNFGKLLWPGLNAIYGKNYADHPIEYTKLFDTFTSRKAFEEDVGISSFGLASVKPEGAAGTYDSEQQGFVSRYTHVVYFNGFIITEEMYDDDQYDIVGERKARGLARSLRHTKETVCANVYNRAFNSSYTGGDGLELCSTAHLNVSGGTYSNELATAADLSEASLEQSCIDLMAFTDDRGLKINAMPEKLIVATGNVFEAERILKSSLRSGTADNDINALNAMGKFRDVVVNHYLTDADAFFIRTNVQDGMKYFERKADSFAQDNDFDTSNAKFKGQMRFSAGWTDPKGIFGSPGA